MPASRIAFFNGSFVEEDSVRLHVSDLSIQRGYGIFDFFRLINNRPLFMEDYLDRFFRSAQALGLAVPCGREKIRSAILELATRNGIPSSGMRLELTGGYSPDGYAIGNPNCFIIHQPLHPRSAELVAQGIKVITHPHVRELPHVKSINYLTGVWLQEKVRAAGAHDVLYHSNGEVSEFPRSNFFIVTQDDVVATPDKNILPGITRMKTLALARTHFAAEERTVTLQDVRAAKEAFLTSTTKQLIPVVQIDGAPVGDGRPGRITQALDGMFMELAAFNEA